MIKILIIFGILISWIVTLTVSNINAIYLDDILILLFLSLYLSYVIYKNSHWSIALAYTYFSFIAIPRICFPLFFWKGFQLYDIVGFECLVTKAHLFLTVAILGFVLLPKQHIKSLKILFMLFAFVDSVTMMGKWIKNWDLIIRSQNTEPYFLFSNAAVDASFIACLIPFFLERKSRISVSLLILACFITKSSSGVLGVGLAISVYYLISQKRLNLKVLGKITLVCITAASIGYLMQGENIVYSSGRTAIWKMAFEHWKNNENIFFGTGAGTFLMFGQGIQASQALQFGKDSIIAFPTMHNDPLQILFETGVIGLGFTIALFTIALFKARNNPAVFASLITYGGISFIQMPLRINLFAIFGAWLFISAFGTSKELRGNKASEKQIKKDIKYSEKHQLKVLT